MMGEAVSGGISSTLISPCFFRGGGRGKDTVVAQLVGKDML